MKTTLSSLAAFYIIIIIIICSCGTPKKFEHAVYFRDSITAAERIVLNKQAVIAPGDRLSINITAINQEAAQAFNATATSATGSTTSGYLVDTSGDIQLLQLGDLHVGGMTAEQLKDTLQQQLVNYVKGPLVTVAIINFKINVMGEVSKPGPIEVPDGKITILQAINQAGDFTQFSKRDSILIIRESNGARQFARVDISSNHIFESPFYYLQQNDLLYIEPEKEKFQSNDVALNRSLRYLGIVTTVLSTVVLIISITK